MELGPTILEENGHLWFYFMKDRFLSCKKCGFIRRIDGKNKPCKGVTKIILR